MIIPLILSTMIFDIYEQGKGYFGSLNSEHSYSFIEI